MEYIVLAVLATIFLLGTKRTAEVASLLQSVEQRRNLAVRILGFLAVSIWFNMLPALLLTIYMREHHFLAPEIYDTDLGRATIVGLYVTPLVLFTTAIFVIQPVIAFLEHTRPRLRSWNNLPALLMAGFLVAAATNVSDPEKIYLIVVASAVLSIYISVTLHAGIETHLKLHFLPLLAIAIVTAAMFTLPKGIESLVSTELRAFSSGGEVSAVIKTSDAVFEGRLLLATREAAYLQLNPSHTEFGTAQCLLRIPIANSILQSNIDGITALGGASPIRDCSKSPSSRFIPDSKPSAASPTASAPQTQRN